MKSTIIKHHLVIAENDKSDIPIANIHPGEVYCITVMKEMYTLKFFLSLIKTLSEKNRVGLINSNTALGHNELFLTENIAQTADLCQTLTDVIYHIKRWICLYEDPIILINDLGSLHSAPGKKKESGKKEHDRICSELKQIAHRFNITIVTCHIAPSRNDGVPKV